MTFQEFTKEEILNFYEIAWHEMGPNPNRRVLWENNIFYLGDLLFTTMETLNGLPGINKKALDRLLQSLAEQHNITIPTEKEKEEILNTIPAEKKLMLMEIEILRLEQKCESLYDNILNLQGKTEPLYKKGRKPFDYMKKAKEILADTENLVSPIAKLLEDMSYKTKGAAGLCTILGLHKGRCLIEELDEYVDNSCGKCIEILLARHYWKKYSTEQAAYDGEAPEKVIRLTEFGLYRDITGSCPKCGHHVRADRGENFCCRCGHPLIWQKESPEKPLERNLLFEDDLVSEISTLEEKLRQLQAQNRQNIQRKVRNYEIL